MRSAVAVAAAAAAAAAVGSGVDEGGTGGQPRKRVEPLCDERCARNDTALPLQHEFHDAPRGQRRQLPNVPPIPRERPPMGCRALLALPNATTAAAAAVAAATAAATAVATAGAGVIASDEH